MGQLEDMLVFTRVVEAGSITRAAEQLNMAKSAISKRLSVLEHRLGIKLITRTTRQSSITEAGQAYYQGCQLIIDEIEELNCHASSQARSLQGTLKIAAPLSFGIHHLTPALDSFLKQHPDLTLEMDFSDKKIDIVEQGVDLALRIGQSYTAKVSDSRLQARKIAPIKHILCASPDYLAKHGTPRTPIELESHKLLKYRHSDTTGLSLTDSKGSVHKVQLDSHFIANNGDVLKLLAESNHGIVHLPTFITWQAIANQTLVPLLADYQLVELQAYALYPENRYLPLKVRHLIDFLIERFSHHPYWDK
ncbi:LysR family transcriptional regulator [Shewanella surugensis]|uniref:LysR family transcriptional regulator n=1 Tax=Shewanella surugensis TaxID=212020 RepID=A0ABT0LCP3_9GAMM|nr:LysR family transcriptional regulator [Shewanella surugensis]MCL1125112.1 LysR family transcriptional regulator [Shewanella surugensis]